MTEFCNGTDHGPLPSNRNFRSAPVVSTAIDPRSYLHSGKSVHDGTGGGGGSGGGNVGQNKFPLYNATGNSTGTVRSLGTRRCRLGFPAGIRHPLANRLQLWSPGCRHPHPLREYVVYRAFHLECRVLKKRDWRGEVNMFP